MKKYLFITFFCILLNVAACGSEGMKQSSETLETSSETSEEASSLSFQDLLTPGNLMDADAVNQYLGVDVDALETSVENVADAPENVILVAAMANDYSEICDAIFSFNQSQGEYKVEVKRYEKEDAMLLDLVRGEGCDVLVLNPGTLKILGNKDALEDLNPYIDNSDLIDLDDMFPAVKECGTINGKYLGILPSFYVTALLVEKGYTNNGGWTVDEYLKLMDLYPEIPVSVNVNVKEYGSWFSNELVRVPEMFVDWESRTCNYDSDEFISLIERIRNYTLQFPERKETAVVIPKASYLYDREMQVMVVHMGAGSMFEKYKSIRDAFFEDYELVGIPNESGETEYQLTSTNIIYSMNAKSGKQEAAWSFLEYILSEEYQETIMGQGGSYFAARRDVVDKRLQEEVAMDPNALVDDVLYTYYNSYLNERVSNRGEFTETDREHLLYILDHVSGEASVLFSTEIGVIFSEEMRAFATGDKSAEETAKNIQNRISLFLME